MKSFWKVVNHVCAFVQVRRCAKSGLRNVLHILAYSHYHSVYFQIAIAVAIVVIVALELYDVSVSSDGIEYQTQCILGTDYDSTSLCVYTYVWPRLFKYWMSDAPLMKQMHMFPDSLMPCSRVPSVCHVTSVQVDALRHFTGCELPHFLDPVHHMQCLWSRKYT